MKGLFQNGEFVGSSQKYTLDIPFFKQIGAQHTSANVLNVSADKTLNPYSYATWGTCHQATNATLLKAGISFTILDLGVSWDMYVTTAVYGNYGGQLGTRIWAGAEASNNY
ncbi:MAG: hypothetical protein PHY73_04935 [Candidatus Omnitrophica bacterium]|nr:hypothetical protein [Candidatus Omnitrophota bacterium]